MAQTTYSERPGLEDASVSSGAGSAVPGLSDADRESIDLFVNLASAIGLSRSVSEIYGLLFVSPEPLCLEDFCTLLGMSRGSASQGLRLLRNLGAVQPVILPGDRRTFYRVEIRLRVLIAGFLKEQVKPRLEGWADRIAHLEAAGEKLEGARRRMVRERARQLRGWGEKARFTLPMLMKLLGASESQAVGRDGATKDGEGAE